MEREIKFRAKRADGSAWVYGDLRQENSGNKVIMTNLKTWEDNGGNVDAYGENIIVNPNTIGQYTGRRDKNGKEVYEGDILKWNDRVVDYMRVGNKCVVYYDEMRCCFSPLNNYLWNTFEVIGNIYDNPKLLEED